MPSKDAGFVEMRSFEVGKDGFCIIHMTTTMNKGDARCMWDRLAGNRPGRANCVLTNAVIAYVRKEINP